jgi:hypothetical protein
VIEMNAGPEIRVTDFLLIHQEQVLSSPLQHIHFGMLNEGAQEKIRRSGWAGFWRGSFVKVIHAPEATEQRKKGGLAWY